MDNEMWGIPFTAGALVGLAAVSSAGAAVTSETDDARVHADLQVLAGRSVLFGHQSVGMNLLDGVVELASREGAPLRVLDVTGAPSSPPGTLAHLFVPENGKPEVKLKSFARALESLPPTGPDIALVKFCYVDFEPSTDPIALFDLYRSMIASLQAKRPATRFVHVTAPLSTVQVGPKAWVKRLLGRTPYGLAENARREEFNARLRAAYGDREPIFDLARVESTLPDGSRSTATWGGRSFPVLAETYTDDGGHLNERGRLKAARELVAVLAAVELPGDEVPGEGAGGRGASPLPHR